MNFRDYLKREWNSSTTICLGTPQQNGVAERRNKTLLDMVRSLMSFSELPISFWGYALEMTIYILNRVPTKSVSLTPFELWNGWKPSLQHLHVWGCPAHVRKMNADKLESRTTLCHFVGYPKETKGFYFYDTKDQIVFVSRNATFLEEDYILNHVRKGRDSI